MSQDPETHRDLGVPVLKDRKIVGIITRKDMLRKSEETQLGLLMSPNPVTIHPDTLLGEAATLILKHRVRRLPWKRTDPVGSSRWPT